MNLLTRLHREEEGMETMQVVFIIAAAALVLVAIGVFWSTIKSYGQKSLTALFQYTW
jgi:hypothetical protein